MLLAYIKLSVDVGIYLNKEEYLKIRYKVNILVGHIVLHLLYTALPDPHNLKLITIELKGIV